MKYLHTYRVTLVICIRMCMGIPICTHTKHDDLSHLKVIYVVGLYRNNMMRSLVSDAKQSLNK
jgi:hypothetical protein